MNDVAALIEKFWLGTTKSLRIAAGHIFADISESTQHIGFVVWKNSFISINLSKLFCSVGLNLTHESEKSRISIYKCWDAESHDKRRW